VPGVAPPYRLTAAAAEPFRLLRANLKYSALGHRLSSVAVTSPSPGEGKTTVAWNLAAVAAQAGTVALLIDADLRRAALGGRAEEARARGLSDVLVGEETLNEAVVAIPVVDRTVDGPALATFDLLLAGSPLPNTTELLESERMGALLAEATQLYELVIVDTPPATFVSEAIPLLTMIDGVVVVSRRGSTTREAACRLRDQLNMLRVPTLGVALNRARKGPRPTE
jgi:capsular exopolysaccharide synthesis family protein